MTFGANSTLHGGQDALDAELSIEVSDAATMLRLHRRFIMDRLRWENVENIVTCFEDIKSTQTICIVRGELINTNRRLHGWGPAKNDAMRIRVCQRFRDKTQSWFSVEHTCRWSMVNAE